MDEEALDLQLWRTLNNMHEYECFKMVFENPSPRIDYSIVLMAVKRLREK
jgi:hypothetical protein